MGPRVFSESQAGTVVAVRPLRRRVDLIMINVSAWMHAHSNSLDHNYLEQVEVYGGGSVVRYTHQN